MPGRSIHHYLEIADHGMPEFYTEVAVLAWPVSQGEKGIIDGGVIDLSGKMDAAGVLNWGKSAGRVTLEVGDASS